MLSHQFSSSPNKKIPMTITNVSLLLGKTKLVHLAPNEKNVVPSRPRKFPSCYIPMETNGITSFLKFVEGTMIPSSETPMYKEYHTSKIILISQRFDI